MRGLGRITDLPDIGNIVVANHNGVPIHVSNVGKVALGDAPRLGQFGYMDKNEAVEGVLFLRTGDAAIKVDRVFSLVLLFRCDLDLNGFRWL